MLSYCQGCITSANTKGLKAAQINRPARKKAQNTTQHKEENEYASQHLCNAFQAQFYNIVSLWPNRKAQHPPHLTSPKEENHKTAPCK